MKKFLLFAGALLALTTAQAEVKTETFTIVENPTAGALQQYGLFKDMKEPGELTQGDVTLKWGAIYDENSWTFTTGDLTVECKDNQKLKSVTFLNIDSMSPVPADDLTAVYDESDPTSYGTVVSSGEFVSDGDYTAVWTSTEDVYSVTFAMHDVQLLFAKVVVEFEEGVTDGVAAVEAEAAPVYYDLGGNRVDSDRVAKGIYVRVSGDKAEKVLVK